MRTHTLTKHPHFHIESLELHKNSIHLVIILIGLPQFAFYHADFPSLYPQFPMLIAVSRNQYRQINLWSSAKFSEQRCIIHKPCDRDKAYKPSRKNTIRELPQLRASRNPMEMAMSMKENKKMAMWVSERSGHREGRRILKLRIIILSLTFNLFFHFHFHDVFVNVAYMHVRATNSKCLS